MNGQIYWMLELDVVAGRGDDLRALIRDMVTSVRDGEPGTLVYEWSTSADGSRCHTYERYADSEALLAHLGNFGANFAERFLAILKPTRLVVYGSPSDAAREALAPFGPTYMNPAEWFTRSPQRTS